MKIASWNINSLRKRQDRLFAWLENTQPDVVCLQETKCSDEQFPALALEAAGYQSAYHGEKSYNGVALLSKVKPLDVRASLCDEIDDPQARVIAATVQGIRIFSIYAPNGQAVGSPATNTNSNGLDGCAIVYPRKKILTCSSAVISMSRPRTQMCMTRSYGTVPLCVLKVSAPLSRNYASSD